MKQDKDYRIKVVLTAMIIFFIIGQYGPEKKEAQQSVCNLANLESGYECDFIDTYQNILGDGVPLDTCMEKTFGEFGTVLQSAQLTCSQNNCFIGRQTESATFGAPLAPDTFGCFQSVPDGLLAKSKEDCKNDGTAFTTDDDYDILCKAYPPGVDSSTRECNAAMTGIANIIQDIAPDLDLGCRTSFYITIFGGALIVLMIFAAM